MTSMPIDVGDDSTLMSSGPRPFTRSSENVGTLSCGQVLGERYRVGQVLGTGGMGIVYEARHVGLGSPVAIKVIRPELAEHSEPLSLFKHEARATALLRSEHTVRVFDFGELESGAPFLVMERLEGQDLGELISNSGRLPVDVAVEYAMQACAGLAAAHSVGLIHRDIKPANLFLDQHRADEGVIKVLDFGASKWLWTDPLDAPAADVSASVGSPVYQSPEQLANPYEVDQRSDIWSLGAVLFELLTGERAFASPESNQVFSNILYEATPSIREHGTAVAPELEAVVQRCLEKHPVQRFASVDELRLALSPFSSRRAATARLPSSESENAPQSGRRNAMR